MIHSPERFRVPTKGPDKVDFFLNWTRAVDNCEYVKMQVNGGNAILIPKSAFLRIALLLGNEEEQDSLIPTKSVRIRQFRKEFTIKVLEDVRKGEEIKFTGTFDVPLNADVLPILASPDTMV